MLFNSHSFIAIGFFMSRRRWSLLHNLQCACAAPRETSGLHLQRPGGFACPRRFTPVTAAACPWYPGFGRGCHLLDANESQEQWPSVVSVAEVCGKKPRMEKVTVFPQ